MHTVHTLGGSQEVTFLTEKGLYQVLFTSRKPIAKQFKNWVCEVVHDLRIKGTYTLENKIKTIKDQNEHLINQLNIKDQKNKQEVELERHNTLLKIFDKENVVYIAIVQKFTNGSFIIKIGTSFNIIKRYYDLKNDFGQCTFLEIYKCVNYIQCEHYLHNESDELSRFKYKEPINEFLSTEVYLVNNQND